MEQKSSFFKSNPDIIHFVVFCIISSLGWFVPAPAPMTEMGIKIVFLFVASAYGWAMTRQVWPSLMTLLLIPFTGIAGFRDLVSGTFGNENWVFLITIFILIAFLTESGADTYIAAWILNLKAIKGHPWRFLFAFLSVCFLLSAFVNFIAMCFFMWGIVYRIAELGNAEKQDKTSSILVFCVVAAGLLGSSAVPWSPPVLLVLGTFADAMGGAVSATKYLLFSFPFSFLAIVGLTLLCRYGFKLDIGFLADSSLEVMEKKYMQRTRKTTIGLISVLVFAVMIILPSILPKDSVISGFLGTLSLVGKLFLLFLILSFLREDGKPMFNMIELATKGVSWGMLIMVAAIYGLSNAIFNVDTGISTFLQESLAPTLSALPKSIFIIALIFISIGVTQFLTNATTAIILLVPTVSLAGTFGINQEVLVVTVIITSTMALLFAPGGATSQILHGNSEWITPKQIWKYGVPTLILYGVLIMGYALIWCMF